jgi:hypothetical protein
MSMKRLLLLGLAALLLSPGVLRAAGTISFGGYNWVVRGAGRGGPGPNDWEPGNVSVDTNGYLHLRLTQRDGKWLCAELYTRERLGFGRYEFRLTGPVDKLDKNVVLGLFNYPTSDIGPDGTHEIDIEFARWGKPDAPIGNYTVWPAAKGLSHETKTFTLTLAGDASIHAFQWTATNVVFESFQEGQGGNSGKLAVWEYRPADPAARISHQAMPVHMNLWCFKGQPPGDNKEVEVIIRSFKFTPL